MCVFYEISREEGGWGMAATFDVNGVVGLRFEFQRGCELSTQGFGIFMCRKYGARPLSTGIPPLRSNLS